MAIQLGATFVGRSFSGDKRQLHTMLKAAIAHNGTVMLDVVSPCVTFNDHEGSTKSYKYMQAHEEPLHEVSFVPAFEEINVEYDPGTTDTTFESITTQQLVVVSGMSIGTLFTLFVLPAVYVAIATDHRAAAESPRSKEIEEFDLGQRALKPT